jgi:23S rRNA pseudouridine2605 synthase
MIRAGRVRLNGAVRRDPETAVNLSFDRVEVDERTAVATRRVYLMLNKPRGLVTSASDEKGRATVYDLLRPFNGSAPPAGKDPATAPVASGVWVAPVGRLDKASEGLLLMTNDSEWAARVLAPETHLDKTYHVQIDRIAEDQLLASLRKGVQHDGETLRVHSVNRLRSGQKNSWLEVVLDEGKNRQIRRMLQTVGVDVLRLVRVAIGSLALGDLAKGVSRPLSTEEKTQLDNAIRRARNGPAY